jgi:Ca2+-binding EF-hand superfamily protein
VTTTPLTGIAGEYDADNDGEIDVTELGDAGRAFTGGEIDLDELTEIAVEFTN